MVLLLITRYDWAFHFNPSFSNDMVSSQIYLVKRGLRKGDYAFFQGVLHKEGDELVLKCGSKTDLIISTQSIEKEQERGRKNGLLFLLLGSILLAGGVYGIMNSHVFFIHCKARGH